MPHESRESLRSTHRFADLKRHCQRRLWVGCRPSRFRSSWRSVRIGRCNKWRSRKPGHGQQQSQRIALHSGRWSVLTGRLRMAKVLRSLLGGV